MHPSGFNGHVLLLAIFYFFGMTDYICTVFKFIIIIVNREKEILNVKHRYASLIHSALINSLLRIYMRHNLTFKFYIFVAGSYIFYYLNSRFSCTCH